MHGVFYVNPQGVVMTFSQALSEQQHRMVDMVKVGLEKGHGGGNWRRLCYLLIDKLEKWES